MIPFSLSVSLCPCDNTSLCVYAPLSHRLSLCRRKDYRQQSSVSTADNPRGISTDSGEKQYAHAETKCILVPAVHVWTLGAGLVRAIQTSRTDEGYRKNAEQHDMPTAHNYPTSLLPFFFLNVYFPNIFYVSSMREKGLEVLLIPLLTNAEHTAQLTLETMNISKWINEINYDNVLSWFFFFFLFLTHFYWDDNC